MSKIQNQAIAYTSFFRDILKFIFFLVLTDKKHKNKKISKILNFKFENLIQGKGVADSVEMAQFRSAANYGVVAKAPQLCVHR